MMARILVADDEPGVRQFLGTVLEGAGHHVWEASSGKEAVRLMRQTTIDLVILDLVMPGGEGIETIQMLRKEHPGLRIIAVSGAFSEPYLGASLRTAEMLGARASCPKPFSADTVLETVRRVLDSA